MHASDKLYFGRMLSKLALNLGRELSEDLVDIFFESLMQYDLEAIKQAAIHINATFKKFPVVADFHELLRDKSAQHVGSDEAWAIALHMLDERETVIVTDEIREAWNAALPVMQLGDEVGARMAFKDVYGRLNKTHPPRWNISPGEDQQLRHERVAEAVSLGRLHESALLVYPALEHGTSEALVSGYLGYVSKQSDKEKVKEQLGKLKAILGGCERKRSRVEESLAKDLVPEIPAHKRADGFAEIERARRELS